jgi:hypothetical protein
MCLQSLRSRGEVRLAYNIVPIKTHSGLVTRQRHRNTVRDACPHHVSNCRATQVVYQDFADAGALAGGCPCALEVSDRLTIEMEHVRAIQAVIRIRAFDDLKQLPRKG